MFGRIIIAAALLAPLAACATNKPEAPTVFIPPPVIKSCYEIAELQRVVIPAEYQTYYAITEIENPPYEPIQRREELQREVKPEQISYQDSEGNEVTNICEEGEVAQTLPADTTPPVQ